jgi:arsenate reductase
VTDPPGAGAGSLPRVLFLCVHNSARSQMAEGLLRTIAGGRFEAFSAGAQATEVRPLAIRAMAEVGIDISGQRSKTVEEFDGQAFEWVVTVCDDAKEACPYFPGERQLHWSFDDPSAVEGTEAECLEVFRRVRDEIAARIRSELVDAG